MATDPSHPEKLVFSREELLESESSAEPLVAGGVRCHGGFDADGRYRSPRTLHRGPAIGAWQERLAAEGTQLVDIPRELMPPQYPNVAQAKLLLREGVRDPVVRALTIISIVEGFGAIIREVRVPDLDALFAEPIEGTALAHLRAGLFEAHARDESGYRDEGGHKQMWEAARDLALENPKVPGDVLMRMMGRGGRPRARERAFPALDPDLERMLATMAQVLVVEVFAMGTFAWGEELLSDPEVSAAPEEAARLVSYIRSDESPHVEYLRSALSEARARTIRTVDGGEVSGQVVVDGLLHRVLRSVTSERPREQRAELRRNLSHAMKVARDPAGLLERFDALETRWTPPSRTGFEPRPVASA
ncbi:MAG: hypothetical protein QNK04_20675 [Myxococcota bacterium]|nr:hypothetical protein [Myxococcota bacterium]